MQSPTYNDVLSSILTDYSNLIPGADTTPGSDIHARAAALAAAVWGAYNHQEWIARQILPDTCDSATLDRHAAIHGLSRKPVASASGTVLLTGQDGTVVPTGTFFVTADGIAMTSSAPGTIGVPTTGQGSVSATAAPGGVVGNIAGTAALTVQNPPPGLNSSAFTKNNSFSGGTDAESDASLKARLLDKLQKPPAGGNKNDYRQWALSVPGVADAMVFPLRLGFGSTSVVIMGPGSGAARIPSNSTLITDVSNYINSVRPVGNQIFQVFWPAVQPVDVTVGVHLGAGYSFATVQAQVSAAVNSYVGSLMPLETLRLSRLTSIAMGIDGVDNAVVSAPPADVVAPDNGGVIVMMIVPGVIAVNQL
ncbi:MAG: baseplate J/gp47 family protein [Proteobacteria bacterium]|nr:baseplate J/gp47 family protein [Pseudomonadota bacterium]